MTETIDLHKGLTHGEALKAVLQAVSDDTPGFFNFGRLMPWYDVCMLFFITGERRIGKTFFFTRVMCMLYLEYGYQTVWLRNRLVELQDPAFATSFLADMKKLGYCPEEWDARQDGVYTCKGDSGKLVCSFKSLSTFSNSRGGAWPDVAMILLDEFQDESGRFPKKACTGLLSLTKTIFSGRDGRCFLLSNSISCMNPYYAHFRVWPEKPVSVFEDKALAIEKCSGYYRRAIGRKNQWNKVYKAGVGYGDYADESEDERMNMIASVPKGAEAVNWLIKANGNTYRAYMAKGRYYFKAYTGKPGQCLVYVTSNADLDGRAIMVPARMAKALGDMFKNGMARFQDANTMFDLMTVIFPSEIFG